MSTDLQEWACGAGQELDELRETSQSNNLLDRGVTCTKERGSEGLNLYYKTYQQV